MISRDELMAIADQVNLRPQVVEKDYVLGWVLVGIARDPILNVHYTNKNTEQLASSIKKINIH